MLFNSAEFIFGFVPLVLLGFFLLARWHTAAALLWLTAASLVFYGWWHPASLPVLLGSIAFNYGLGRVLASSPSKGLLAAGVVTNLALLLHYKYAGFLLQNWVALSGGPVPASGPQELPLGISFFTFTQIAFLVDVYRHQASDRSLVRYGLFVTYYPHLIAGPVLHHAEMMPQFARADIFRFNAQRLADGGTYFVLGLFKKVVLADRFAAYADPAFAAAGREVLSFFEAWGAALAYTLQLYFDFSGYSDMAIGLALMIGVHLPLNFHSPYKARDIADFWRRWHMTLSRFLRDYLYIPLGGNRHGRARRWLNLWLTMLLGGAWHGAGWTFILWGALHGAYLVVHAAWRSLLDRVAPGLMLPRPVAWALTFLAVVVAWVVFRAQDLPSAWSVLRGMAGLNGSLLPSQLMDFLPPLGRLASGAGKVPYLADGTVMGAVEMALMLALGLLLVGRAPALHELQPRARTWLLVPCAALAFQQVLYGRGSPFLYFQF